MKKNFTLRHDLFQVGLILFVALLHGLFYVFLMPPWQHYDEPNHFEHVWLAANRGRIVLADDYDAEMSRAVIVSMIRNHFYKEIGNNSAWGDPDAQVKIPGVSQLDEPPAYYHIAGLPLRLLKTQDIAVQMYAARLVSMFFYLLTILAAWGMMREFTRPDNPLRWIMPLTLALLPGFTDVMTAVNDDSAAVACASLFFLGSARLLRRKFSFLNLLWVIIIAGLSYYVKNTAMIVLAVLPLVLLLAILRGKWRKLAWAITLIGVVLGLASLWQGTEPAYWYRATTQAGSIRILSQEAVQGQYVFHLVSPARSIPGWLPPAYQSLPLDVGRALQGKKMSLGFWMWASEPVKIIAPALNTPVQSKTRTIELTETPQFFTVRMNMPKDRIRLWVTLAPSLRKGSEVSLYYDGFILAEGKRPLDQPPESISEDGEKGLWGGEPFVNLLRNPSAEQSWPQVRLFWDAQSARLLPDDTRVSLILASLYDIKETRKYYQDMSGHFFRTFWAKFGWGHVSMIGQKPYRLILLISLVAVAGAVVGVIRHWRRMPWDILIVFAVTALLLWMATITRWVPFMTQAAIYLPTARYTYPVILPIVLVLTYGSFQIITLLVRAGCWLRKKIKPAWQGQDEKFSQTLEAGLIMLYVALLLLLDVYSFISIASFYNFI